MKLLPPYPPMEALLANRIPRGGEWQYEPKWDGFRCLVFHHRGEVFLQSKSGQPLARYFPELVQALGRVEREEFALDSEIVIPVGDRLSFDDLLQRIHPAESRIRKLARERPSLLIVFDLLSDGARVLTGEPLAVRRRRLEEFAWKHFGGIDSLRLSPATRDVRIAERWLHEGGGALDGVIAKRLDAPYRPGERDAMQKVKVRRTADCVVGGFRYASYARVVGSLLLGLYDEVGLLHHVGFVSGIPRDEREKLTTLLESQIRPPGFTGRAPGGPSRWSTDRSTEWHPLRPSLVVEVAYDHYSGGRFRHGARLIRFRPDKSPAQCTLGQVSREASVAPLDLGASADNPAAKF